MSQTTPRQTVLALAASFFMAGIALRGSKVALALAALDLGAGALAVGILVALYSVFPVLLSVFIGRITDRIGIKKPIFWGALGMTVALALPAVHFSMATLFVSPALLGLAHVFLHISVHNAVGAASANEDRTRNFATLSLCISVATFVGPLSAGTVIDHAGFRLAFALLAGFSFLGVLPVVFFGRVLGASHGAQIRNAGGRMRDLLAVPWLRRTILIGAVVSAGSELFSFYVPIYGRSIDLSATAIGGILSAFGIAAFLIRLSVSRLIRHLTEIVLLTAAMFIAAVCYGIFPLIDHTVSLFIVAFVLGAGLGVASPLTLTLAYNHAPSGRAGEALGMRVTVNRAAQIVVPLVFGALGAAAGVAPVFWVNALILLIGGGLSTLGIRSDRRKATRPPPSP